MTKKNIIIKLANLPALRLFVVFSTADDHATCLIYLVTYDCRFINSLSGGKMAMITLCGRLWICNSTDSNSFSFRQLAMC